MDFNTCNIKSIQYWIFDMDGTILSLENLYYKLFKDTLSEVWQIKDFDKHTFLTEFAGRKVTKALPDFLMKKGFKLSNKELAVEIAKWREKRNDMLKSNFQQYVSIKPGVRELFDYLKEHDLHIALATSSSQKTTTTLLTGTGLKKYFDVIVTGDDVENSKPDPETFNKAIQRLTADKKQTAIFEDSVNGLKAAHLVGVACVIAVHTPGFNDEVVKSEDHVIQSFKTLLDILKK